MRKLSGKVRATIAVFAGFVILCIGVIGAGSVVTRDIPAGVVAAGNPCKVLRPITEADRLTLSEIDRLTPPHFRHKKRPLSECDRGRFYFYLRNISR